MSNILETARERFHDALKGIPIAVMGNTLPQHGALFRAGILPAPGLAVCARGHEPFATTCHNLQLAGEPHPDMVWGELGSYKRLEEWLLERNRRSLLIVPYQMKPRMLRLIERTNAYVTCPGPETFMAMENRGALYGALNQAAVPHTPRLWFEDKGEAPTVGELLRHFGTKHVTVECELSFGGSGMTFCPLIESLEAALARIPPKTPFFIGPYRGNTAEEGFWYETSGAFVVAKDGRVWVDMPTHKPHGLTIQETGCGHTGAGGDDWGQRFPEHQLHAWLYETAAVVRQLASTHNFFGYGGHDVLIQCQGDQREWHDLQPRFLGNSEMRSLRSVQQGQLPLDAIHIALWLHQQGLMADISWLPDPDAYNHQALFESDRAGWQFNVPAPKQPMVVTQSIEGHLSFVDNELVPNPNGVIIASGTPCQGAIMTPTNGGAYGGEVWPRRFLGYGQIWYPGAPVDGAFLPPIFTAVSEGLTDFGRHIIPAAQRAMKLEPVS